MSWNIKDETINSQQHYCRELNKENEKLRAQLEKAEKILKEIAHSHESPDGHNPNPHPVVCSYSESISRKYFADKEAGR